MQKFKEQCIAKEKDKKTAATHLIKKYEEPAEDLHDLAIVAERLDEPTITFGELKERLRKDWLL